MLEFVEWLALVATLPTRNTALRMRLWRALKGLGCATLRDGVYLLPAQDETGVALRALAGEVRAASGSAEVLHVAADGMQSDSFRSLFDRSGDFGDLIQAMQATERNDKALRRFRRTFDALVNIDYFPGPAQDQARHALDDLAARLSPGEPHAAATAIPRLARTNFSGRTWATRKNMWVDRMASAWLIHRHIDPAATFLWLDTPAACPPDALGFDFDGARFSHVAQRGQVPERVTFEVLAASFGLDADPAITRIAGIVHCLDVGGAMVAAANGIEAVLAGLRAAAPNDSALLVEASRIFDSLYLNYCKESDHG